MSSRGKQKKERKVHKEYQYNKTIEWYDNVINKLRDMQKDIKII